MIKETVDLLGYKAKDKVTGYEGTVISVSFDLFGCVQIALKPAMNKEGKVEEGIWIDVNRITLIETEKGRVMDLPEFEHVKIPQKYTKGPAEKPRCK